MCFKMCKKCCKTILFAALVGGVVYYLKSKNSDGEEMGCVIADNFRRKKDKFVNACDCVRDETKDMASEVKHAARCSAGDVAEGVKTAGENVRSDMKKAVENIRDDMGAIKHTADEMFESGEHA
ncbi:MAG: hypothetical protein LUD01_03790 [Clostridiales bacterium]|nr:hypothetical protein [Clostridiales bacterium]